MKVDEGMVRLNDLAVELGVTGQSLRYHLKNAKSGLGVGAKKEDDRPTGEFLLPIDSVVRYLQWLQLHGKQVQKQKIANLLQELKRTKLPSNGKA